MKILFDQGTPVPLRKELAGHEIVAASERGFEKLSNGALLQAAEAEFDLLLTTDQNLKYQQNLAGRRLAIAVLSTTSWPKIRRSVAQIQAAIDTIKPGGFIEIEIPN